MPIHQMQCLFFSTVSCPSDSQFLKFYSCLCHISMSKHNKDKSQQRITALASGFSVLFDRKKNKKPIRSLKSRLLLPNYPPHPPTLPLLLIMYVALVLIHDFIQKSSVAPYQTLYCPRFDSPYASSPPSPSSNTSRFMSMPLPLPSLPSQSFFNLSLCCSTSAYS